LEEDKKMMNFIVIIQRNTDYVKVRSLGPPKKTVFTGVPQYIIVMTFRYKLNFELTGVPWIVQVQ
jgi:hypothetical protein